MKRSIQMSLVSSVLALSTNLLAGSVLSSEKSSAVEGSSSTTLLPLGKTLSEGMFELDLKTVQSVGDAKLYDDKGKKQKTYYGSKVKRVNTLGTAVIVKYGVLSDLSLQAMVPFVFRTDVTTEGRDFQTGQKITSKFKKEGTAGDAELGALLNLMRREDLILSAGLGLRVPTGTWDKDGLVTGNAAYDLGARFNADYQILSGLWVSAQHQEEAELASLERKSSKDLPDADRKIHKAGFNRETRVQLGYNAAEGFDVKTRYIYNHKAEKRNRDSVAVQKAKDTHFVGAGFGVNGFAADLPVSVELMYDHLVAGKNTNPLDTSTVELTLSAYM